MYSSSYCTSCSFLLKIDEGIKFAKMVVAMGDEKELSSRGYLALGIGYSLLASEGNVPVTYGGSKQFPAHSQVLTVHYYHFSSIHLKEKDGDWYIYL